MTATEIKQREKEGIERHRENLDRIAFIMLREFGMDVYKNPAFKDPNVARIAAQLLEGIKP